MEVRLRGRDVTKMLFKKGAEAYLYVEQWYGLHVIRKHRISKSYRVPQLDHEIRRTRTIREVRLLDEAGKAGVPTPSVLFVDLDETTIIMQRVEGDKLKDIVDSMGRDKREAVFNRIGKQIALLHKNNIIHGDLTTSNMILTSSDRVAFIDFGLGEFSASVENKGVDMHLMHRALESTHYKYSAECFKAIVDGYRETLGLEQANEIMKRVQEIELRGRYFSRKKANYHSN